MTTENNKLLAEFIGAIWISPISKITHQQEVTNRLTFKNGEFVTDYNQLKYHSDWNWLMQVVEKIESLGGVITIGNVICFIESKYTEDSIRIREATKIEAVYKACTEFVKFYNEQPR